MGCGFWIVIAIIVLVALYWILSRLALEQPPPPIADADTQRIVKEYESFPQELWFRNNPCIFEKYLDCSVYRYIIYESNGRVIYDSKPSYPTLESAKELRNSYEYNRCISFFQGGALRGNSVNLAFLAKDGNRYRIVHVSEYLYSEKDEEY